MSGINLPSEVVAVARDWRYSDEYLGNLVRSYTGREPCSCPEAGLDPMCPIHGSTAGDIRDSFSQGRGDE